jgi:hypothetical protein
MNFGVMCEKMSTIEIIKTADPCVTAIVSLIVAFAVVILNYRIQLKMRKEATVPMGSLRLTHPTRL